MEAELKAAKSTAISKRPIFMFSFNNRFEPMLKMYTSERVVAIYLVVLGLVLVAGSSWVHGTGWR